MTDSGVSKKMFFGCLIGQQLANMAISETEGRHRLYYFIGMWLLVVIYWAKQAALDYLKDIKK